MSCRAPHLGGPVGSIRCSLLCNGGRFLIDRVTAILLISPDPRALADFYRNALGLPLEDEEHPGVPLHYGCDVGGVHLAIHSPGKEALLPAPPPLGTVRDTRASYGSGIPIRLSQDAALPSARLAVVDLVVTMLVQ